MYIHVSGGRKFYGMMEYIYKIMEYIIFTLYLFFVFLSVQIWFLWKDINKDELKFKSFANESFFKKNSIYVFSFSTFFIIRDLEFVNEKYFGLFNILALLSIVLFTYSWYNTLKLHLKKKILPQEFKPKKEKITI
jgi:hypothetical protein